METYPRIVGSELPPPVWPKGMQALFLTIINRRFVSEANYIKACMTVCRAFGLELKPVKGWKGKNKHLLARLLAGYWWPRPRKRNETQIDTFHREQQEEIAEKLLKNFDPMAMTSSVRARTVFQFLDQCRTMPVKECQKLLGPRFWRCNMCGKAFFAGTRRRVRGYCSGGKCGSKATARKRVEEVRAAEHAAKLKRAEAMLGKMKPGPYLKERLAGKIGVKPKWVTRQVNSGALTVPSLLSAHLHPDPKANARRARKTKAPRLEFTPYALPKRIIEEGPLWTTKHPKYGITQGDRNAVRYFNHLLRQLSKSPTADDDKKHVAGVKFTSKTVVSDETVGADNWKPDGRDRRGEYKILSTVTGKEVRLYRE